jgi:transposase
MSTLNKWITAHRDTDVVSKEDLGLAQENDRLRRENRILKEERDILKSHPVLRGSKANDLDSSKNTQIVFQRTDCAKSSGLVLAVCAHSAIDQPAAGNDLIW